MLPPLPNSVRIFEYLHLSPSDQQFVKEFCVMLVDPIPRADIEQVFDILCIDFGSQIFLQKSQILRNLARITQRVRISLSSIPQFSPSASLFLDSVLPTGN
ncbi:hypothetical protein BKA69DRAFT_649588 [Paraphysoderma sedebokerense]|nr:hypothetical protein BKA69DRAFT_649588 [Paraphysoderma sedebokerense]